MQPHAYLLDAFLVLNEQLNSWNVDVEPRPLRGALHWSVDAAIVLAAHTHRQSQEQSDRYLLEGFSIRRGCIDQKESGFYLISISARLLASVGRQHLD